MPSSDEVSWAQFDRFVLSGVPHAIDIAHDLAGSILTIPVAPAFDLTIADLCFYSPVHFAYRRGMLLRFLRVLEVLRDDANWERLRSCRSAQHTLIDSFTETASKRDGECLDLLRAWMQLQSESNPRLEKSATILLSNRQSLRLPASKV